MKGKQSASYYTKDEVLACRTENPIAKEGESNAQRSHLVVKFLLCWFWFGFSVDVAD